MNSKKNEFLPVLDYALVEFLPQKGQYEVLKEFLKQKKYYGNLKLKIIKILEISKNPKNF